MIKIKRVYDKVDIHDGLRILVDRLWPRGIRRSSQNIDLWLKDVAPSTELRKWFMHQPNKWESFKKKYEAELKDSKALAKLVDIALTTDTITMLYSTKDTEHNNALVLLKVLNRRVAAARRKNSNRIKAIR